MATVVPTGSVIQYDKGIATFPMNSTYVGTSAVPIPAFTRVTLDSSVTLIPAGTANSVAIGVTQAVGNNLSGFAVVKLTSSEGTFRVTASGAITAGSSVYPQAAGQVGGASSGSNTSIGIALNAAVNAGDQVDLIRTSNTL